MQRLSTRKLRVNMTIKIFKKGRLVDSIRRYKKSQIFRYINLIPFKETTFNILISVDYGIGKNESYHISKDTLLKALHSYTEKSLIDFLDQPEAPNERYNG